MKRSTAYFLFLLFLFIACRPPGHRYTDTAAYQQKAFRKIDSLKQLLHNGDLIFRNGTDEVSRAARSFNRKDTSYSHCGLVFVENGTPYVYHALGGAYNPDQKLLRQPVDSFASPTENNAVGAWRYPLDSIQVLQLKSVVQQYYKQGLQFDMFFNFQSDDKMYCAEFVYKSLRNATNGKLVPPVKTDTLPFGVTTDDLFLYPESKLVGKEFFDH